MKDKVNNFEETAVNLTNYFKSSCICFFKILLYKKSIWKTFAVSIEINKPTVEQIHIQECDVYTYWSEQLKDQPDLLLSSLMHNSSINEPKIMKLRENNCYERINWILYCCGFENSL